MKFKCTLVAALVVWACQAAEAKVARFQNGVAPRADYVGCVDTRISIYNDAEARGRRGGEGKAPVFRTFSSARRILVKFDLAGAPKGQPVRKALLRVHCTVPTSLTSKMFAAPLTRAWDESASGFEHTKTDDDKTPKGNWAKKGGDYDDTAAVTADARGGTFGHGFEFDVTKIVADWVAGKRVNHGLILWSSQHTQHEIASSEWSVPAYRPELLIASAADELKPWAAPAKKVALSPVAATAGKAGEGYQTFAIGMRNDAVVRSMANAYVKTNPKLAGRWGWMPHLRVGGGAGEFNATLMRFELSCLGKAQDAAVNSAKLRLYVAGGSKGVRFGIYAARADAPAWQAKTVSLKEPAAGKPWGKGGFRAAFDDAPAAVAAITFPGPKDKDPRAFIEWDVTGAVRAAAGRTLSLLIAHDVEGGAFDAFSSKYDDIDSRPALTIEAAPAPMVSDDMPLIQLPGVPTGDYWVKPMKAIHKKFKGTPNTLGQYGDSITITMAFMATHSYGSCIPAKCPDDVKKRIQIVDAYANKKLWRDWKHPKYGNNGSMTVAWAFANVDAWQKLCKPEVAVILFGTNDVSYGPVPPDHTEMMARVVDRCLADGTIPIITTLPPRGDQIRSARVMARVRELRRAQIAIARARKIPLIDFYTEIVSRQPAKWDKVLMGDSLHPSYPRKYQKDFTEEGLSNSGYTLRNYLTMMIYADIIEKVLKPPNKAK